MKKLIRDTYIINIPDTKTDFYAGEKNGEKCWPIRYGQGCYGDCSDCRSRWLEQFERMKNLPSDLLKVKKEGGGH